MNFPLFSMMWSMSATVLIGVFMIAALVLGFDAIPQIIATVLVGVLIACPIAFVLTKKIGSIGSE